MGLLALSLRTLSVGELRNISYGICSITIELACVSCCCVASMDTLCRRVAEYTSELVNMAYPLSQHVWFVRGVH